MQNSFPIFALVQVHADEGARTREMKINDLQATLQPQFLNWYFHIFFN